MRTVLPLLLLALAGAALGQTETRSATLYRCGEQGRDLRDQPCPAGSAASTQHLPYDQPSAAQTAEAQHRAAREARLAREMTQAREKAEREALAANRKATALQAPRAAAPRDKAASSPQGKKPKAGHTPAREKRKIHGPAAPPQRGAKTTAPDAARDREPASR